MIHVEPAHPLEPAALLPAALGDLQSFVNRTGTFPADAFHALALAAAVSAIADDPQLHGQVVLRGSAALWLRYGHRRRIRDVDLITTHLQPDGGTPDGVQRELHRHVSGVLDRSLPERFPAFDRWRDLLKQSVKADLCPVYAPTPCSWVELPLRPAGRILIAHADYVLCEKLVTFLIYASDASLQTRPQELWDIHAVLSAHPRLVSTARVAELLPAVRDGPNRPIVSLTNAFVQSCRTPALHAYERLSQRNPDCPPFNEAWDTFVAFVRDVLG